MKKTKNGKCHKINSKSTPTHTPTHTMEPETLEDMILPEEIRHIIEKNSLTSLLLMGPPGTGKTTCARLLAKHFRIACFEAIKNSKLGLQEVRQLQEDIHRQVRSISSRDEISLVVLLDEIDSITDNAQCSLRCLIESFPQVCFLFTGNDFIFDNALCSRLKMIHFGYPSLPTLVEFLHQRFPDCPEEILVRLTTRNHGDIRSSLQDIQFWKSHPEDFLLQLEHDEYTTQRFLETVLCEDPIPEDSLLSFVETMITRDMASVHNMVVHLFRRVHEKPQEGVLYSMRFLRFLLSLEQTTLSWRGHATEEQKQVDLFRLLVMMNQTLSQRTGK